jgi:hypothetical protein
MVKITGCNMAAALLIESREVDEDGVRNMSFSEW